MKLLFLFGNQAVGKTTVGQELMKITDLRLFHNHMTIEPVIEIFGSFRMDVVVKIREPILDAFMKTDLYGMIFTGMFAFDMPEDHEYFWGIAKRFEEHGAEIYVVELHAPMDVRLERNASERRLQTKPSQRNVEASNERIRRQTHRFLSQPGEVPYANHMQIDNTDITPEVVARMIKETFSL